MLPDLYSFLYLPFRNIYPGNGRYLETIPNKLKDYSVSLVCPGLSFKTPDLGNVQHVFYSDVQTTSIDLF